MRPPGSLTSQRSVPSVWFPTPPGVMVMVLLDPEVGDMLAAPALHAIVNGPADFGQVGEAVKPCVKFEPFEWEVFTPLGDRLTAITAMVAETVTDTSMVATCPKVLVAVNRITPDTDVFSSGGLPLKVVVGLPDDTALTPEPLMRLHDPLKLTGAPVSCETVTEPVALALPSHGPVVEIEL